MKLFRWLSTAIVLALLVAACTPLSNGGTNSGSSTTPTTSQPVADGSPLTCPADIQVAILGNTDCQTPRSLRVAYGVESLMQRGYTGKGQTVIDIVSYDSPTLQQDMDTFDQEFDLPPITLQVLSPIGTVPFDPHNKEMSGWADETDLDVQTIHAIAPGAHIVVLTSPVDETEGMACHPLGFLNTALYKLASSATYTRDFHDITQGNNSVQVDGTTVPGYNAAPGWDPVTGLGSPDAENLIPDLIAAISTA